MWEAIAVEEILPFESLIVSWRWHRKAIVGCCGLALRWKLFRVCVLVCVWLLLGSAQGLLPRSVHLSKLPSWPGYSLFALCPIFHSNRCTCTSASARVTSASARVKTPWSFNPGYSSLLCDIRPAIFPLYVIYS
jgi:hypothetical protein